MRIDIQNVCVVREGRELLSKLSLSINNGDFASILGPSGAGKTTLLNVMSGLIVQDEGQVLLDGKDASNTAPHLRSISLVFQDSRLFPHMSVGENVAFPLRVRGQSRAERLKRAEELLSRVQLEGYGSRYPNQLSGGQRQRVALARALAAEPGAILLDEPFSGLDESLREDMRSLVMSLHQATGTTMVMVTHDAMEAMTMSDVIFYIEDGTLMQAGAPGELLSAPKVSGILEGFGTTRALDGIVHDGVFSYKRLHLRASAVGDGPAVLVVRPHGIEVLSSKSGASS